MNRDIISQLKNKLKINPMLWISTSKKDRYSVNYSYYDTGTGKSHIVFFGYYNNAIDAINFRDSIVSDFYCFNPTDIYSRDFLDIKTMSIGSYILGSDGKLFGVNGIEMLPKSNKTYSKNDMMMNISVKNEIGKIIKTYISKFDLSNIYHGNAVKVSTERYICGDFDGFYYTNNGDGRDVVSSNNRKDMPQRIKSKILNPSVLYGVTRSGRHTVYIAKVQIKINGKKHQIGSIGSFDNEFEANMFSLDMFYLLTGKFHKTDKRRIYGI